MTPGARGYGGRETADRQRWILPAPGETPESLAGRRSLQKRVKSSIQGSDTVYMLRREIHAFAALTTRSIKHLT